MARTTKGVKTSLSIVFLGVVLLGLIRAIDLPQHSPTQSLPKIVVTPGQTPATDKPTGELPAQSQTDSDSVSCSDIFPMSDFDPESALTILEASSNPEHWVAAYMIHQMTDDTQNVNLLEQAMALDPKNPLLTRTLWQACLKSNSEFCAEHNWAERYLATDPENTDAWIAVMAQKYAAGDISGAHQAFAAAIAAPKNTNYIIDRVRLMDRSLVASSGWSIAIRFSYGFGNAAMDRSGATAVYKICNDMAEIDRHWLPTCLQYGQRLAGDAKTHLDTSMASAIQSKAYRALGEVERANALDTARRAKQMDLSVDVFAQVFFLQDANIAYEFLDLWQSHGEHRAQAFVAQHYQSAPAAEKARFKEALEKCDSEEQFFY